MNERIFVIEDDENIREIINLALVSNGYEVVQFDNAIDALELMKKETPSLAIFDLMLPKMSGIDAIKKIRETNNELPILILSAKDREIDKVNGLDSGSDDYMTKPFNNMELVARVKSQLRRYDKPLNIGGDGIIKVRDLVIDEVAKKVIVRGVDVKATATEYKILHLLASNLGKTFSIKEIYEKVWEENFYKSENTVTVHIRRIREKIEINTKEPEYIKVVWGIGYKIEK